jgi:hypothetical protein
MATIWKELLFLHGHFARPQDVLDEAARPTAVGGAQAEVPLRADAVARRQAPAPRETAAAATDADGLACGGCR